MLSRASLHAQLAPDARPGGLSPLNAAIVVLIAASVVVAILETEPALHVGREAAFRAVEMGFAAVFALEYLARLWAAGEDPRYRGLRGRVAYALTPTALIDLLALASLAAPLADGNGALLRLLRLARILRLAKLGRFSRAFRALSEAVRLRGHELVASLVIAGLLLLASSSLLYVVEGGAQPEAFGSIPRAMWWSVATLTTVGYGDVFPVTPLGKLLAGATAIAGIGLIALPTGILAAAFSDALQRAREAKEPAGDA
ncbi:ion transporter [Salinarimonas sp.]|uniref:potassium channel family protein n=1 Tax=Salinarimonas sp. TaxID=2766526 RepID=UPI0032D97D74